LRKAFRTKSRELHPDHHGPDEQLKMIQLSAINNEAYSTLSNFESRTKYILELNGMLGDPSNHVMDLGFLAEIMDLNEEIMACEMDGKNIPQHLQDQIINMDQALIMSLNKEASAYDDSANKEIRDELLKKVKEIYLKRRYILRILEKIDTFASR
jgi:molecular chaperone HscB